MAQGNVVWILGAGFSKPLGGPLLNELFRPGAVQQMADRFPKARYAAPQGPNTRARLLLEAVLWLYNYGIDFDNGPVPMLFHTVSPEHGEKLWIDAEDFLDVLDLAARPPRATPGTDEVKPSPLVRLVLQFLGHARPDGDIGRWLQEARKNPQGFLEAMNAEAQRLMVAQCSAFMLNADRETERWAPFSKWGQSLKASDTVITFNYDCAAELVGEGKLVVAIDDATLKQGTQAKLLKLHGSTNWTKIRNKSHFQIDLNNGDFACLDDECFKWRCVGTPGPNKREITDYLKPVWDEARLAIHNAEAIVFVGYRFPPSDSDAREKILGAIQENASHHLLLHTVLGPNISDESTSRLRGLLESRMSERRRLARVDRSSDEACRQDANLRGGKTSAGHPASNLPLYYGIVPHPLYSQDFVSAPGNLFQPHHAPGWPS